MWWIVSHLIPGLFIFLSGILTVFYREYVPNNSLKFFVYYRIIFGIIVIALAFFFRHPAG